MITELPADGPSDVLTGRIFTGVQAEPVWPSLSSQERVGNWIRNLFGFARSPKVPNKFNWDDQHVVPPASEQGQLAACICYAASLAAATSYRIKSGKSISIAPRVMHLCTMELPPGNGTNSRDFEKAALASGLPITADEATAATMNSQTQCDLFSALPRLKVASLRRFKSTDEVKTALSTAGPVVVHMTLYDDFWHHYVAGTIYAVSPESTPLTSHAVCLIGYDDSRQCWIGVNSHGPGWGAEGRFMLKYGECDVMAPGAAAYALNVQV